MNDWGTMWAEFCRQMFEKNGYVKVLQGLLATAEIAVGGLLIGIVIGTLLAVAKVVPKYNQYLCFSQLKRSV